MFQEKRSGTTTQRPVLTELLVILRAGDTVTVAHLNRLGRNCAHLMQVVVDLHACQVPLWKPGVFHQQAVMMRLAQTFQTP